MNKTKEENSSLHFDERKKILIQKKSNVTENKTDSKETTEQKLVSTVKSSMEVEYTEEGIKLAYNGLVEEKKFHDKRLIELKDTLKEAGEMTPELQELKDKLMLIAKIDQAEKSKADIQTTEDRLKVVNKEINEIKETIGTRLKL